MGGIYMYIDCVYEVVYTCMLIVYKGGIYMYIDFVYGWYIHVYWLCQWGGINMSVRS